MKAISLQVVAAIGLVASFSISAVAQDKSRIPPRAVYQAMLDAGKQQGWIQFRNYAGKQLVYFTTLQAMHCRLKGIRYSINSRELDSEFPLVKCNPQNPFAVPPDAVPEDILITLAPGTASFVAVQAIWEDDTVSEIAVYEPCEDVGDQSCAWPID